jgi:hypothetical protein
MIRTPLLPLRASSAIAPAFLRMLRVAPAVLLVGSLLAAAGCGDDNQRVPEDFPSGARPAPLPPGADLAAGRAELPAPPPAEPSVELTPPAKNPAAEARETAGEPGQTPAGHLRIAGTYQADTDAIVTCDVRAGRGLQLTFDSAKAPIVEVIISDFLGDGHYVAATSVLARDAPHGVRLAAGEAQIDVRVSEVDRPHVRSLLSGSFSGDYASKGVKGQAAGTFDRCLYAGALP